MGDGTRSISEPGADREAWDAPVDEGRRRNEELEILKSIAEALNATVDLRQSLERALALVAELLGLQTGWVLLLDEPGENPYLAAGRELPPGFTSDPRRMSGRCYCTDTFRRGDLSGAANVNVVACSRLRGLVEEGDENGTGGLRCHASIPLYAGRDRKKLGVMNVASRQWKELSPEELRLLHTIGNMVGIAVERAQWYARSTEIGALEERTRLAREIHDTLAQGLTAIALRLDAADALLEGGAEAGKIREPIAEALRITRTSLEEARRSMLDLRAVPLEDRSLAEALSELVEEAGSGGTSVRLEAVGTARPLPARLETGIYRVAQEALGNALRHAAARSIVVRLEITPDRAVVTVTDDGRGFAIDRTNEARFGLIGLRERARLLGGETTIESEPGAGTRIEVSVPLT